MAHWKKTLWIMFVAQLLSAVGFSTIFPFLPHYVEALGSSTGLSLVFLAGAVFSAQAITMMIASPLWGALSDRVGRKPMVERAMFGGAVIIFLMAFVGSAEELVLLRAVQGLITGVVSASNALVASVAPRERTGFALGALQTALWSGVALGPILGGVMADAYGFRAAFVVTAALLLAGGLLVLIGVDERFVPPEEGRSLAGFMDDWKRIVRAPGVAVTFLARFTAWLGRGVLVPVLPLFIPMLLANTSRVGTFTGLVIGVASLTGTLSALVLGGLGDRIGHRRILIASSLAAALAYAPMSFVADIWQLLALNALAGAAVGGVMPSLSALLAGGTGRGEVGSTFGLDNAIVAASRAVAPLLGVGVATLVALGAGTETGYRAVFLAGASLFLVTLAVAVRRLPRGAAAPAD